LPFFFSHTGRAVAAAVEQGADLARLVARDDHRLVADKALLEGVGAGSSLWPTQTQVFLKIRSISSSKMAASL
jgi:hypothetical protein